VLPIGAFSSATSHDREASARLVDDRLVVGSTAVVLAERRAPDAGPLSLWQTA
jgi:hypothetical protein